MTKASSMPRAARKKRSSPGNSSPRVLSLRTYSARSCAGLGTPSVAIAPKGYQATVAGANLCEPDVLASFQFGSFHSDAGADCLPNACVVRFPFQRIRVPESHANRMVLRQIPNSVVPLGCAHAEKHSEVLVRKPRWIRNQQRVLAVLAERNCVQATFHRAD